MAHNVRCRFCYKIYDLWDVKVLARYADATVFKTPCCDKQADDRTWKGIPDFEELDAPRYDEFGNRYIMKNGRIYMNGAEKDEIP